MGVSIRRVSELWPQAMVLLGLALLAWPVLLGFWSSWRAQQGISQVEASYDAMKDVAVQALADEATAYNTSLLDGTSRDGVAPYAHQLVLGDSEMMAHISIPCLSLDLPIYHGTDEATLMTGVGHVEGSALPVGTLGGRCVLAAHSGMPSARMFDDIGSMEIGDRFVIRTCGRTLVYAVVESRVVLPEQTDALLPREDEDLVTLVTCTPRGINTHRLLVTGERCPSDVHEELAPKPAVFFNPRTMPLLIGMGMVGFFVVAGYVRHICTSSARRSCV